MRHYSIIIFLAALLFFSCTDKQKAPNPWGNIALTTNGDSSVSRSLDDIIVGGELIMVTLSGPTTYYEYRGKTLGLHYLLCEQFCRSIGVALRVDVCRDTLEMIRRVAAGEADLVAMALTKSYEGVCDCGGAAMGRWHWFVGGDNTSLAAAIDSWLTAARVSAVREQEEYYLSPQSIQRTNYSPMRDVARGIISVYDPLFRRYATRAGWDWRLLAAQCYQESTFDPRAHSWAGACGLMQIMPSTADHLHLSRDDLYDPEKNIAAAAQYIAELSRLFADIESSGERIQFVLAAYNGGQHHIRDAMRLTAQHGGNSHRWRDVREYVLLLSNSAYYTDPVVAYGYMRGSETVSYVDNILQRWAYYRGAKGGTAPVLSAPSSTTSSSHTPTAAAQRKEKYTLPKQ